MERCDWGVPFYFLYLFIIKTSHYKIKKFFSASEISESMLQSCILYVFICILLFFSFVLWVSHFTNIFKHKYKSLILRLKQAHNYESLKSGHRLQHFSRSRILLKSKVRNLCSIPILATYIIPRPPLLYHWRRWDNPLQCVYNIRKSTKIIDGEGEKGVEVVGFPDQQYHCWHPFRNKQNRKCISF